MGSVKDDYIHMKHMPGALLGSRSFTSTSEYPPNLGNGTFNSTEHNETTHHGVYIT